MVRGQSQGFAYSPCICKGVGIAALQRLLPSCAVTCVSSSSHNVRGYCRLPYSPCVGVQCKPYSCPKSSVRCVFRQMIEKSKADYTDPVPLILALLQWNEIMYLSLCSERAWSCEMLTLMGVESIRHLAGLGPHMDKCDISGVIDSTVAIYFP